MIVFPNAKINIGLNVVSKRNDGYHNIESVFYPIGLKDVLEVLPQDHNIDYCTIVGTGMDFGQENLVTKAFDLMNKKWKLNHALKIYMLKNIPLGAGLGGGSSDASFMLKCINEMFDLNIPSEELCSLALELGADCPFFIANKPVHVTGVGEIFEDIPIDLSNYFLVLINPGIPISTAEAFRGIAPRIPKKKIIEIINQDIKSWKNELFNDFEENIFRIYPTIGKLKNRLYEQGALYSSMSGTGSSVYGIFEEEVDVTNIAGNYFTWCGYL